MIFDSREECPLLVLKHNFLQNLLPPPPSRLRYCPIPECSLHTIMTGALWAMSDYFLSTALEDKSETGNVETYQFNVIQIHEEMAL